MLAYAYAAKFLRSLAAGGQGSRTASRSTAARPASGCTPIQQPRAQPVQPRPRHRQIGRWPKLRRLARNKRRDDKPPRWERQRLQSATFINAVLESYEVDVVTTFCLFRFPELSQPICQCFDNEQYW